jgi:tRNA A37 threonylcarbamoyladenosine synthetase subunit TsaC/SUA5/YrdC
MDKFAATSSMLSGLDPSSDEAKSVQKDLSKHISIITGAG